MRARAARASSTRTETGAVTTLESLTTAAAEISANEPAKAFELEKAAATKLKTMGVKIVDSVDKSGFTKIADPNSKPMKKNPLVNRLESLARVGQNGPLPGDREPITLGVTEPFFTTMKLSFYAGILLALPVLLYQAYSYILPAFKPGERKVVQQHVRAAGSRDAARTALEKRAAGSRHHRADAHQCKAGARRREDDVLGPDRVAGDKGPTRRGAP